MPETLIDGRDMQPPEPLERVLEALTTLGAGDRIRLLVRCEPGPLYRMLDLNGYRHSTARSDDGTVEVEIWEGRASQIREA